MKRFVEHDMANINPAFQVRIKDISKLCLYVGICIYTFLFASFSMDAYAAVINFAGELGVIMVDTGGGVYSGTLVGTYFSGNINDDSANGYITNGTTTTNFGCCIAAGGLDITDNEVMDADTASLLNTLAGSNQFYEGQIFDVVQIEGDETTAGGGRIEVGLTYVLDGNTFSNESLANYPFDTNAVLISLFFIAEHNAVGDDIYSVIGKLDQPLPPIADVTFAGQLDLVDDSGGGIYSGIPVGTDVSVIINPYTANGSITIGTKTTIWDCCIWAGGLEVGNNEVLDSDTYTLINTLAGSSLINPGSPVDTINIAGDTTTTGGGRLEVGLFYIFAAGTFSNNHFNNYPFDPTKVLISGFYMTEHNAADVEIYSAYGKSPTCGVSDTDQDSYKDLCDNCPYIANNDQSDVDSDGVGDVCDDFPNDPDYASDNDNDGLPDDWELYYFSDLNEGGTSDRDGDSLINSDEYAEGTDPNNPDSDNDGLNDGLEVNLLGTDPTLTDSDNNGISDSDEDFDLDGYTNIEEVQCESDPADPSSKCFKGLPFLMLLLD